MSENYFSVSELPSIVLKVERVHSNGVGRCEVVLESGFLKSLPEHEAERSNLNSAVTDNKNRWMHLTKIRKQNIGSLWGSRALIFFDMFNHELMFAKATVGWLHAQLPKLRKMFFSERTRKELTFSRRLSKTNRQSRTNVSLKMFKIQKR